MHDALLIISQEIVNYRNQIAKGKGLDPKQARVLQGYIQSLVSLSKEAREHTDDQDLANMSDEELINLVETIKSKRIQEDKSDESN